MDVWAWVVIVIAVLFIWGGISIAWRAFSRPPRIRSPEMRKLDQSYFEGDISREEYMWRKAELERKEREGKQGQ